MAVGGVIKSIAGDCAISAGKIVDENVFFDGFLAAIGFGTNTGR